MDMKMLFPPATKANHLTSQASAGSDSVRAQILKRELLAHVGKRFAVDFDLWINEIV
jgi:hypothetical protein